MGYQEATCELVMKILTKQFPIGIYQFIEIKAFHTDGSFVNKFQPAFHQKMACSHSLPGNLTWNKNLEMTLNLLAPPISR